MVYRSKFFITFVHIYLGFCIWVLIDDGFDINYWSFSFASVFAVLLTHIMIRCIKITVRDEYLRAYDFWGKYYSVEWGDLLNVKPVRIAGLKYMKVEHKMSKRPLWIPLFLDDMTGFRREVCKRLQETHPLRIYLERNHGE